MSKAPDTNPVLGCSRSAPYTHADFSKDLQVYHLTNKHHPNKLYDGISANFVNSIQLKQNPSEDYSHKMKNLYMDQLDHSLHFYKNKLVRINSEADQFKQNYKQNVNSVVLYIEKDKNRRGDAMLDCLKKMKERQNRFVDANKIKNKRIDDYINRNQYTNCLSLAKYQLQNTLKNKQQTNFRDISNTKSMSSSQMKASTMELRQKEINSIHSVNPIQNIKNPNPIKRYSQSDQNNQVIKRGLKLDRDRQNNRRIYRIHNPITNPIEYHIENPYFIDKMQKKYQNI